MVIIASLVTIIELGMKSLFYELYLVLSIFIPLIVTNCAILGRADAFAAKHPVLPAATDGLMMGLGFMAVLVLLDGVRKSVHQVSQREVIVIERFGRYHKTLTAGLSFVVPFIDQPKRYSEKYILTDANGVSVVKQKIDVYKIPTQEEVRARFPALLCRGQ